MTRADPSRARLEVAVDRLMASPAVQEQLRDDARQVASDAMLTLGADLDVDAFDQWFAGVKQQQQAAVRANLRSHLLGLLAAGVLVE